MSNGRGHGQWMSKQWNGIPAGVIDFTADATVGVGTLAPNTAATVLRMLGGYTIEATAGGAFVADDACRITVGIGVVASDSAELGSQALPDPAAEFEFPWLYWRQHQFSVFDSTPSGLEILMFHAHSFDVRSMRKIKPRESLVWIAQYSDEAGAPPVTVRPGGTRVLFAGI